MTLLRLATFLGGASFRLRLALAAGAGALSVLALPPLHLIPLLLLTLPALLWLLDGASGKWQAAATGWSFGFGFFAAGLYWISNALLVEADRFGWMIPLAVGGLGLVLGGYHALGALLLHLARRRLHLAAWQRIALFAALWAGLEMLRGALFTGFTWNPLGLVWTPYASMLQPAAWGGVTLLSLMTVFLASLPALAGPASAGWPQMPGKRPLWIVTGLVALLSVAGSQRVPVREAVPMVDNVRLRLVQPDISQKDKWRHDLRTENLQRYISYSLAEGDAPVTHILWGETALPWPVDGVTDEELRQALAESLADTDAHAVEPALITGVIRRSPPGEPFQVWNSMIALDRQGGLRGSFDKFHLVPFGEYVPLKGLLPLERFSVGGVDFTAGPGPRTLTLPGLPPVGPLICYEVIFPGEVTDRSQRPAWLLNLTNDGWYGVSSGPYQHLALTTLRAVEEGLPVVRVANTGVSAIIDPWGRQVVSLGLDEAGFIDGPLPQPVEPTIYALWGNKVPMAVILMVVLIAIAPVTRRTV